MNCLAHAWKYLDDPDFAIGTCVPDWLGMIDRRVRVQRKRINAYLQESTDSHPHRRIARGIHQHLQDDEVFHGSLTFVKTSVVLSRMVSAENTDETGHRSAFVGHILTELLLDASIEVHTPGTLDRYYDTMSKVSVSRLEDAVNHLATRTTDRIPDFMERNLRERFLFDYLCDDRLLIRMNQILKRVSLEPLPTLNLAWVQRARTLVYENRSDLLGDVK
jgi:hypothetical protein